MATVATVINVIQPHVPVPGTSAEFETALPELADHLELTLDHHNDGTILRSVKLLFADYAGLEAEWLAGTATTVLTAAINSAVPALTWDDEQMTSTQRTAFVGYEVAS